MSYNGMETIASSTMFYFVIFLSAVTCAHLTVDRSIWSHERSSIWWDRIVNQSFNKRDWLENFRMSRDPFLYLCSEFKSSLEKRVTAMRRATPLEQRVTIALWRLATNGDYRTIAHLFGVSRASVCLIVWDVCDAIVQVLLPTYNQTPHGERLQSIVLLVSGFFPCMSVLLMGPISPLCHPWIAPADYYNWKGFHSIILQAVVDHEYRFWNISVGWPGRVHVARVLNNSELFERAQAGTLLSSSLLIHGTFALAGRPRLSSAAFADKTLCTAQQFIKCSKNLQLQIEQSKNGGRKCLWAS